MTAPNPVDVAVGVTDLRDILSSIGLDDSAQGGAADAIRTALTEHNTHLTAISDAAHAVAKAVNDHKSAVATLNAEAPSEQELQAAQQAVIDLADSAADGNASPDQVQGAVDKLSSLLTQKQAAQHKYEHTESRAADTLDGETQDFPLNPQTAMTALTVAQGLLSQLNTLGAGSPFAGGVPAAAPVLEQPGIDPMTLVDSLLDDDDPPKPKHAPVAPPGVGVLPPGAGQTHIVSDMQPPSVNGAQTLSDVSGKPANVFTPAPTQPASTGTQAGGMMPYAPMGGSTGSTGTSATNKIKIDIIDPDPDFTGDDIAQNAATKGIVGRADT